MGIWLFVGVVLAGLLTAAWWMDHAARRRGSRVRHHSEVWYDVREGNRDAEAMNPLSSDTSWTSWNRRNKG